MSAACSTGTALPCPLSVCGPLFHRRGGRALHEGAWQPVPPISLLATPGIKRGGGGEDDNTD